MEVNLGIGDDVMPFFLIIILFIYVCILFYLFLIQFHFQCLDMYACTGIIEIIFNFDMALCHYSV